jgi:hypothetical protein
MSVIINGGAGITFPDTVQETNAVTNTGGTPRYYAARAWGVFNGTVNPCTVLASSNVASITRTGTGTYQVDFSSPMPTANYVITGAARNTVDPDTYSVVFTILGAPTVSSFGLKVVLLQAPDDTPNTRIQNLSYITFAVFA